MKIAYCIPALYYPSGMERVLTLKANYFAEVFGYEIHIILTDKKPYYELHPSITLHQLDIDYDELNEMSFYKKLPKYIAKQGRFKKKLNECLHQIRPDITISLLRRDINFINRMTDGSTKLGEIHFNKSNYQPSARILTGNRKQLLERAVIPATSPVETFHRIEPRGCTGMDGTG